MTALQYSSPRPELRVFQKSFNPVALQEPMTLASGMQAWVVERISGRSVGKEMVCLSSSLLLLDDALPEESADAEDLQSFLRQHNWPVRLVSSVAGVSVVPVDSQRRLHLAPSTASADRWRRLNQLVLAAPGP